ncbi:MAG: gluconolaconase [Bryobacter sp.]|nr:gluconolaconase [Bryobacter sp.]
MSEMRIDEVRPVAALPGGEFTLRGAGLMDREQPRVSFGKHRGGVVIGAEDKLVVRVPEGATEGDLAVEREGGARAEAHGIVGVQIADAVHPVANPAADAEGNIYTTFSGSRGQQTPVSVFKINTNYHSEAFVTDIMNASGLAFSPAGVLHVSSRHEGAVYQITHSGGVNTFVGGMGIATGLCFDPDGNLYVGDRAGTIFKVNAEGDVFVFATLEPSIAAYHLAFGPDGYLYVTGPTTSSNDGVSRVSPKGDVELYYRGLGRPQGLAFDTDGNLYVCASWHGRRGIVRLNGARVAEPFLSGHNIVGLCFLPSRAMAVATNNSIYRVDVGIAGL